MSVEVVVKKPPLSQRWNALRPQFLTEIGNQGVGQARLLVRVDTSNLKTAIKKEVKRDSVEWGVDDVAYAIYQEGFADESLTPRKKPQNSQDPPGFTPYLRPSLAFVGKSIGVFFNRIFGRVFR